MKRILLLLFLISSFSRLGAAQSTVFAFDSIWVPPYICQASHFDVEVFGTVADGSIQYGAQSFSVRNDTILVQFHFVPGPGPAMPYALYRSINVPAPWTFGPYKVVVQGLYNGQVHQILTSQISICQGVSGQPESKKQDPALKLSPNPAHDLLIFETSETGAALVVIKDLSGKTWLSETLNSGRKHQLSVSALPAGTYLFSLQTANGTVLRKFIKQ